MRRRMLVAAASLSAAVTGLVHGCSGQPSVEDLCAWLHDGNCYSKFHDDEAPRTLCAFAAPAGQFAVRGMLDVCILDQGGQVVFDPPLDPTTFPDTGPLAMKFVLPDGTECGSIKYAEKFSFAITINGTEAVAGQGGG